MEVHIKLLCLLAFVLQANSYGYESPDNNELLNKQYQTRDTLYISLEEKVKQIGIKYFLKCIQTWGGTLVIAHRGRPKERFPENALSSLSHLSKFTSIIPEIDVRETRDGVLILMHDKLVDRTTSGKGKVLSMTWDEIRSNYLLDFEGKKTNESPPTLESVLTWDKRPAMLVLDIKQQTNIMSVYKMVKANNLVNNTIFIVYSLENARKLLHEDENVVVMTEIRDQFALNVSENRHLDFNRVMFNTHDINSISQVKQSSFNRKLINLGAMPIFMAQSGQSSIDRQYQEFGSHTYKRLLNINAPLFVTKHPMAAYSAIKEDTVYTKAFDYCTNDTAY